MMVRQAHHDDGNVILSLSQDTLTSFLSPQERGRSRKMFFLGEGDQGSDYSEAPPVKIPSATGGEGLE
jgi:hypothetical protein